MLAAACQALYSTFLLAPRPKRSFSLSIFHLQILDIPHFYSQQMGCSGAEAVLNLRPNSSVAIAYHPHFGSYDDLMLLELDEKLLPDVLQQRVTLRGQPDEDAVLCTQSKTYAIKFVGTSNSSFLIPPSDQSALCENSQVSDDKVYGQVGQQRLAPVIKVAPGNMELIEISPRLDKLKLLLSENPYGSEEVLEVEDLYEGKNKTGLYRWDDLVERVQASNDELRAGLLALSAVEIEGYWRIVEEKYMDMILRMLLHNSVLNDWSLDALDEAEVVRVLASDGFPHKLALHCLDVYGSKMDEDVCANYIWKLNGRRVCVHFAREILKAGKRKMENFMVEWLKQIPDGMQASFDMLEGEVLTEKLGVETWVRAFSVSSLPSTPAERFSILFRERSKWEWKDLHPYIRSIVAQVHSKNTTKPRCRTCF
ncbi:uncharacterized protein LOC110664114 isoform X2 [Hevea brasiliensis]|uniref:uncharacterized protein LOC110664114 isoform X2 n=1 Tax=Hevea brasiliensis TaxID=3981 RepID=UPI0025E8F6B9|nr:uncharacterized protein LOC110664114 isoform X2 [Hevea brasiliensis]